MKTEIIDSSARSWRSLAQLMTECFPYMPRAARDYAIRSYIPGTRILLLQGKMVGVSMMAPPRPERPMTAWLEFIGIAPTHRGQGLGTLLLNDFEAQAADFGFTAIELAADPGDPRAVSFYQARGYRSISHDGINLCFHKDLPPKLRRTPRRYSPPGTPLRVWRAAVFRVILGI